MEGQVGARYDATAIAMLAALEPVRARGATIVNGADLSDKELDKLCQILAENGHILQVEVKDRKGRMTTISRGGSR